MKKWIKRGIVIIGSCLVIVGAAAIYYGTCVNPKRQAIQVLDYSEELTKEFTSKQALEDLEYVYKHICSRHPAWLDGNTEVVEALKAQYEKEKLLLEGKEKVTTLEIWQACAEMTTVMYDGHTGVFYNAETPRYISDVSQLNQYGMPMQIDGIDFETIQENFLASYSYEREEYALSILSRSTISVEQYLALCGVDTSDGVVFTFDTPEGTQDYTYDFVPWEEVQGLEDTGNSDTTESSFISYQIDTDKNTAVFTLAECNYNEEYCNTVDAFWKEVFDEEIENVIVDLRGNGGGNSTVAEYFLGYLNVDSIKGWAYAMRMGPFLYKQDNHVIKNPERDREFDGELYVLTDLQTFSSAMDFAMLVSDNNLGTLIGEASGNMPEGYGDTVMFQTPNAKLGMFVSFKRWWRVDESKGDQPILPDIETNSADALDKAYEIITGVTQYTPDELLDRFLNNEVSAIYEKGATTFMLADLINPESEEEYPMYSIGDRQDYDNDNEPEQELFGPYGSVYFDVRDQKIYAFEFGESTGEYTSSTTYEDAVWIVHEDTSHQGRQMYWLKKYQGGNNVVDEFLLSAEYWDSKDDTYDANSKFTFRDQEITMEEFERLREEIFH